MSSIKSCNQGFWRADLIAVNGFNEQIKGWGPEDKECCARVVNSGVGARHVRFMAQAVHLHHASRAPSGPNPNDAILEATIARRSTRCDVGLDQHLTEFAAGVPTTARPPWKALNVAQGMRVLELDREAVPAIQMFWHGSAAVAHRASVDDLVPAERARSSPVRIRRAGWRSARRAC